MAWVQPPGTPSVGLAFLDVYKKTRDPYYLEAAVETARALVKGQLQSGGWAYSIEFDPDKRKGYAYRSDGRTDAHNVTTLDDDTTQAALRCLIKVDHTLDFKDATIHEAALFGLDSLLRAQYPNGAWPQRYTEFPDPANYPVKKATYPEEWSRVYKGTDYTGYYTLNDNTLADTIALMDLAAETYAEERYRAAWRKAGDFILLAQMPDPQPAWAQQYDVGMHPAWACKFEPPAITGGESQGILRVLLALHAKTGDHRYLDSAGRALAYLKASRLPDGHLARFYELKTNTPLYFTKTYELTYSDADTPTHYSFTSYSSLDAIEADYRAACDAKGEAPPDKKTEPTAAPPSAEEVKKVITALDARGAWVESGRLRYHGEEDPTREVIDTQTFIANIGLLSTYIAAGKE
ncbi:MAG: Pectic acid lyase [Candidatus Hydrogenedentes bacterium ADurb.Bin101]|jgi:PelA/Pel-15E family pectate lyase|nr:MAG: Pectic acid lyase [Candidatus Hydrogenedentes bacterium ADurb.Bin101]